ncbi:MAG: hypothetical protein RBU30_07000, partial [Polyangia bacterium]|nr:hypothetical protein [Polyangia bacterium]
LFDTAVEEHNRANLGRGVEESLDECRLLAAKARERGVPLVAYLSAAFGFVTPGGGLIEAPVERVLALVRSLRALGASTVTLSDLQGVRSPEETGELLGALLHGLGGEASSWLGYHGHHSSPEGGVALAEAAFEAGVRLFDGSLGAVGGCVTGAPGNAPTEGLAAMLGRRGARHGVNAATLARASARFASALRP